MPDLSDLGEQDDEQPQPEPQSQPQSQPEPQPLALRRRRRRVAVALASLGVVLVTGVVITVAVAKHHSGAISDDPGCKEFATQLVGFHTTPPTSSTDYAAYAKYYGAYYFPAAYGSGHAENDQVNKVMIALRDASDTLQSDATQDEMVGTNIPVPQSKVDADTLAFNRALAAVDHTCNLS